MSEQIKELDYVDLRVSPKELRYFVLCGLALMQNVPEDSIFTYCGLSKDEIVEVSLRMREVADKSGVPM
ncbi:hypothetical protein M1B34_17245 [Pseudomonas sp. MAFF 302030]|jgi:hypothetical protein|uniref:Uncharacterized protein n=1 Tax=Pseudomonas morbosilactucae TaxID=2938197 RepID=A0A9X2C7N2_9PSED|nr:hypothetical protein [Pseudomonas morbosilactucae]MCK9799404.1 hypothetical protein [Pseudomonas morbosilactucae]